MMKEAIIRQKQNNQGSRNRNNKITKRRVLLVWLHWD